MVIRISVHSMWPFLELPGRDYLVALPQPISHSWRVGFEDRPTIHAHGSREGYQHCAFRLECDVGAGRARRECRIGISVRETVCFVHPHVAFCPHCSFVYNCVLSLRCYSSITTLLPCVYQSQTALKERSYPALFPIFFVLLYSTSQNPFPW